LYPSLRRIKILEDLGKTHVFLLDPKCVKICSKSPKQYFLIQNTNTHLDLIEVVIKKVSAQLVAVCRRKTEYLYFSLGKFILRKTKNKIEFSVFSDISFRSSGAFSTLKDRF
jgi:hypothetical protein